MNSATASSPRSPAEQARDNNSERDLLLIEALADALAHVTVAGATFVALARTPSGLSVSSNGVFEGLSRDARFRLKTCRYCARLGVAEAASIVGKAEAGRCGSRSKLRAAVISSLAYQLDLEPAFSTEVAVASVDSRLSAPFFETTQSLERGWGLGCDMYCDGVTEARTPLDVLTEQSAWLLSADEVHEVARGAAGRGRVVPVSELRGLRQIPGTTTDK